MVSPEHDVTVPEHTPPNPNPNSNPSSNPNHAKPPTPHSTPGEEDLLPLRMLRVMSRRRVLPHCVLPPCSLHRALLIVFSSSCRPPIVASPSCRPHRRCPPPIVSSSPCPPHHVFHMVSSPTLILILILYGMPV